MKRILLAILGLSALAACGHPDHLTYDYSRSYTDTFMMQADLERESAEGQDYALDGLEATMIRLRSLEEASDTENAEADFEVE